MDAGGKEERARRGTGEEEEEREGGEEERERKRPASKRDNTKAVNHRWHLWPSLVPSLSPQKRREERAW